MKKKPLLITFFILAGIAAGVWLYQNSTPKKITSWDLIGDDAVFVVETSKFNSIFEKTEQLTAFNDLLRKSALGLLSHISGYKTFAAVFPTARDDFDFLLCVETGSSSPISEESLKSGLGKGLTRRSRTYNGIEIAEYFSESSLKFSIAVIEGVTLLSPSPFLIEGAIKLRNTSTTKTFQRSNSGLYRLPTLQSDEGNLYINTVNLENFISLFFEPGTYPRQRVLAGSGMADLKVAEGGLLVNGFLLSGDSSLISLFNDQTPQQIDVEQIISNKVAAVVHYGISDPNAFFIRQEDFLRLKRENLQDSLKSRLESLSIGIESVRKIVGNQIANCYLSKGDGKVTIIKRGHGSENFGILDEIAAKISEQNKDSLYVEKYAGYSIKLIDYRNFLRQLLYPIAPMAEQTFFVEIGDNLLLAEDVELIKNFIDDVETENTWGKSVGWNKFLSTSIQEANLNLYFDGKLVAAMLKDKLSRKSRPLFDSTNFLYLDKGSIQLSRLESNFYLNASFNISNLESKGRANYERATFQFDHPVISSVNVVKSHLSKDVELLIQDSLNGLYLLSKDLKTIWRKKLSGSVVDRIEQIDFYSNNKWQYFFMTHGEMQCVDRLGRDVDDFPKKISPSAELEYSKVVDYDRSKKYRFLFSDVKGNLYLTDKTGTLLPGWDPLPLRARLTTSARHYRALGKDYFMALTQGGLVHLLNRRGETIRGFPLNLGFRPVGDATIKIGATLAKSYFTVVSSDGVRVSIDLNGQIVNREVLIKRSGASLFSLVTSANSSSYILTRIDASKISLLDETGDVLIETENTGSMDWEVSFIETTLKERYYCLHDRQQNFSYFFSGDGTQLLQQPVESSSIPALYFDEAAGSLSIYNVFHRSVSVISIHP